MPISTRSTTSSHEPQAVPNPASEANLPSAATPQPASQAPPNPTSGAARETPSAREAGPTARRAKWRAILPIPAGKALGVLVTAILTLLAAVTLLELPVWHHTHGNILFPLDKAYVNITVGRDLAFYRVWGVSKYAFQSATSSLLYPITLAPLFFILGAHLVIPLIINFVAGAYFLLMLQRMLIRYGFPPVRQFFVLIGAMGLTLLPLLVVSGMEYTLQLLFVFLFMDALAQTLPKPSAPKPPLAATPPTAPAATAITPATRPLYIFALLAVAARYEDLLIIALACLLLGLQKGWRPAAKLAAIAVSPIIIFGIISLIKKSYFLPNAMLIGPYPPYTTIPALIATGAAAWLTIRYSAIAPKPQAALAILILLTIPFTARNAAILAHFEKDCDRIYDEQYLTANFVHLYYFKQTVGTNQPGAVSYFSEGRKLDFTGVASNDVVRMIREYGRTPLYADSLSKKDGIRVAIVADPWFHPDQFPRWTRVATWDIPNADPATAGAPPAPNPSSASPSSAKPPAANARGATERAANESAVNFYAVQPYDTTWLRKRLHEYQHLLPSTVSVRYY